MADEININNELFNPEDMQSPFDSIKEVDAEGREWWNSRKLDETVELQLSTAIK